MMALSNSKRVAPLAAALSVATLTLIMLTGLATETSAADTIKPRPRDAHDDKGRIFSDRCIVLKKKTTKSPDSKCVYGKAKSKREVVLFGDSHALQYGPTMIRLANRNDWRLTALIKQGCAVAQVKFADGCDEWRSNTMRRIVREERPDLVVVSTATTARYKVKAGSKTLSRKKSQPKLVKGMKKTLQRLRDTGAKVVLIRDQHRAPPDTPECVRRHGKKPNKKCSFRPDERRDRQDFDYRAARQVKKVRVIDPTPRFCPKRPCRVVANNMLMYRDSYHITATYARSLASWLDDKLPDLDSPKPGSTGGRSAK